MVLPHHYTMTQPQNNSQQGYLKMYPWLS